MACTVLGIGGTDSSNEDSHQLVMVLEPGGPVELQMAQVVRPSCESRLLSSPWEKKAHTSWTSW